MPTQWGSQWERQVTLFMLTKGWGRCLRLVKFKDGKRHLVPAARAAGRARSIPITPDLVPLCLELLDQEYQRWRRQLPGDQACRGWGRSVLSNWYDKVNRAYFKLSLPGSVIDLSAFADVRWWPDHYRLWPGSYREPKNVDWSQSKHDSGVSRRLRAPLLFNQ